MQYAPEVSTWPAGRDPREGISCVHVIPLGQVQYVPSLVPPLAFAQRHEQYTATSAARSAHCGATTSGPCEGLLDVTGSQDPADKHPSVPPGP
jgi:hypothetical protein